MQPFKISDAAQRLNSTYPTAEEIKILGPRLNMSETFGFVRLWVSEGIPAVFRTSPLLYESVREWVAARLSEHRVDPKTITLIGSARCGYSMSMKEYGRAFNEDSDLDFAIVSEPLFSSLASTFYQWESDFSLEIVKPRSRREERLWKANIDVVPTMIYRGFIDEDKIPPFYRYPAAQQLRQTMAFVIQRLASSPNAPRARYASVRAYRDWQSLVLQLQFNFRSLIRQLSEAVS